MDIGSKREIDRLRSQARREGVSIRTQRRSGASHSPIFSLVDRRTGTVLGAEIQDLADLEAQLSTIVASRTSTPPGPPSAREAPDVRCPKCGTRRFAQFRWCRACGLDYEAYKESPREPAADAADDPSPSPAVSSQPDDQPTERTEPTGQPRMSPRAWLADAIWEAYLFGPWRQVLGVAVAAVLAGVLVTVMINAMR